MTYSRIASAVSVVVAMIAGPLVLASTPAVAEARQVSAAVLLSRLPVRAESHSSSYKRLEFGSWVDANEDGENTRVEVLKAESKVPITVNDAGIVQRGRWLSRYDGRIVTVGSKISIDHLVPLAEAWSSGGWKWSTSKREAYANDLGYAASLVAVSQHADRSKGDNDPVKYLPTKSAYRCAYVRNWIAVKYRWRLSVDRAEKAALKQALGTYCSTTSVTKPTRPVLAELVERPSKSSPVPTPSSAVPTSVPAPTSTAPTVIPAPAPSIITTTVTPEPAPSITAPTVVPAPTPTITAPTVTSAPAPIAMPVSAPTPALYYSNCDAVAAAGAAPLYSWQSGYRADLDGDGDGTACETEAPISTPVTMPTTSPPTSTGTSSGASAICRDGTLSYSQSRSGTCSGHGGVRTWL